MKFTCKLPDKKHYRPLPSSSEGKYFWQDKGSSLVTIVAPIPDPWQQDWVILFAIQKEKNDTYQYPRSLRLLCFEINEKSTDVMLGKIHREVMRGKFVYSQFSPVTFFAFPLEANSMTNIKHLEQQWVLYSVYQRR